MPQIFRGITNQAYDLQVQSKTIFFFNIVQIREII